MRNQGLLSFLIFLLVVVVIWLGARPAFQGLIHEQGLLRDAGLAKQEALALQATVKRLATDYETQQVQAKDYLAAVPKAAAFGQADLIAGLQSMASLAGVVVDSLEIHLDQSPATTSVAAQPYKTIPVRLNASGEYEALKRLLLAIETNLPVLSGKSFTLVSPGGQGAATYNLSATFSVYNLK